MRLAIALTAAAVLATPAIAGPSASKPPGRRASVRDLLGEIARAESRLQALVAEAKLHPHVAMIARYKSLAPLQFADEGRVTVQDLLEKIVAEEADPPEVREAAAHAISSQYAQRNDPDLSMQGKTEKRPRAVFTRLVLPLLTDKDDLVGRGLAQTILRNLWLESGIESRDDEIQAYDPRKKDTWWPARKAWEKQIKRP